MRYTEFRDEIQTALKESPSGLTWAQLREGCGLPYDRPCPTWVKRLETDIGFSRQRGSGRALVWCLPG